MSLLRDCLLLGLDLCENEVQLAAWWGQHKAALRALGEEDWAAVWARKEERKAAWAEQLEERLRRREPQPKFWAE